MGSRRQSIVARAELSKIKGLDHDPYFHWRGEAVTRIENLSDIVFALALGMLISAASPPQTFGDLREFLFSIIPVTAAFSVLVGIWNNHFTFFRRYGVADRTIIVLNAILLFVVLYLAYPLRFAFDSFFGFIIGLTGDYSRLAEMELDFEDSGVILGYFGAGFAVIHLLFALMYRHVVSRRDLLKLTPAEMIITRRSIFVHCCNILIASGMGVIAYLSPLNGLAGCIMFLTGFFPMIASWRYKLPPA